MSIVFNFELFDFMKRCYTLTSTTFDGHLTFNYSEEGVLMSFYNDAELKPEHLEFLNKNFPVLENLVEVLAGKSKTIKIRLTTAELTFEMFWDAYKVKMNKKEALVAWGKLTTAEQLEAYENIPVYNYFLMTRPNQNKLYPDSYLRGKFKNDYRATVQIAKGQV